MADELKAEHWRGVVAEQEASGLSAAAFRRALRQIQGDAAGLFLHVYTGEGIPIRAIREICGKTLPARAPTQNIRPRMTRIARMG